MKLKKFVPFIPVVALGVATGLFACAHTSGDRAEKTDSSAIADSASIAESQRQHLLTLHEDSIAVAKADSLTRYSRLTDADFKLVADELDIEVAAMKAVVIIEAGEKMEGFAAPGIPIVNFDASMWKKFGTKGSGKGDPNATVPKGISGHALKEWTQLTNARKKNVDGANMSTFWGMFQIGGFNYKKCDCNSVGEFVERMSYSELEQLELFARFITNSGMVNDIKNKNWAAFARKYNGPNYAKRGYHTKMARAYQKFKKK